MIYCILGQTASGKTSLAIKIAREFNLPIISADALQCYKIMQIGTDKPKKDEIDGIEYYFNDCYPLDKEMSVYLFQSEGRKILDKLNQDQRDCILVGGNFLYVKALLFDYKFKNESNDREYINYLNSLNINELQKILYEKNKEIYKTIDTDNPRRVIRAILSNQSLNEKNENLKSGKSLLYDTNFYQILISVEEGNKKIDERVDKMIEEGFIDEVKYLISKYPKDLRPFTSIGYKEIIEKLNKNEDIDQGTINLIKIHTHQYAKKQRTFLNNQYKNINKGSKLEIYDMIKQNILEDRK